MISKVKVIILFSIIAFFSLPVVVVKSTGGGIAGIVTDPKGLAVLGASVIAKENVTEQTFTVITTTDGRYKFEGLQPGTYTITVTAKGFADAIREGIEVEDGIVKTADIKLEIAPVETVVEVSSKTANTDPVYQTLRQQGKSDQDFTSSAAVNNLVIKREGAEFTLRSGEMYFTPPVQGQTTSAVFLGDGLLTVVPPIDVEKKSLMVFTEEPKLSEQFSTLVLHFTDKTADEIRASSNTSSSPGTQAARARSVFRENQEVLRKRLRTNRELRTLTSLYAPEQPGFFIAFIDGKRFNKLVFIYDPFCMSNVAPEEVALLSYGETDGGIWTAFHRPEEYIKGTASSSEDHRAIDITHHEIDGRIKGTQLVASDKVTFRSLVDGTRVVPFELFASLRVSRVTDEQGNDLNFIQEQKDQDADLGVILPKGMEAGKSYSITLHYAGGDALRDSGNGNFILIPRNTWYPANANTLFAEDRATFSMTFRYPKGNTFIATGAAEGVEIKDGDLMVGKWSSGSTELSVAGFNYGRFKKKQVADKESGYNIEFYANDQIPDELRSLQLGIEQAESAGIETGTTLGSISTTGMADSALADAQNSMRLYNAYFGKLPYSRLALSQQPAANFGQAWPTLVFMPYTAFIDTTQRMQMMGVRGGTSTFWRYVLPHEVAHQWWGHIIGWKSYRDQWMSEGFAEFSASLYVQATRGPDKFNDFWEEQRKQIVEGTPATRGRKPYTVGPVTQGFRLNNAKTGAVFQNLAYPKGAYILHMLRMMMFDRKTRDARFQAMMKDFIRTHFNQGISTEDLKRAVEKHMTPEMDVDKNGTMNWFFDEWVYGTDVPAYKFEYQIAADGALSGKITQSGVSKNFVMVVPIYLDFGKGWSRLGTVTMAGNSTLELPPVKLPPGLKRAALAALNDVLATSIQNVR